MNTRTNKTVLLIILMICLATAVYSAVGTFTFRTSGASDTTEVVDLRYPQKVPEDASVTTDSIADGSITNDKLAEPVSVANGGTGATTAAEALAALGGASLNGSSTVAFAAKHLSISTASSAGEIQAISGVSYGAHSRNHQIDAAQTISGYKYCTPGASLTVPISVHNGTSTRKSFAGTLTVQSIRYNFPDESTHTVYSVVGYDTTLGAVVIQTVNGSGGAASCTVALPAAGELRFTNTSANDTVITILFNGTTGI
jgi:hypothetical protein